MPADFVTGIARSVRNGRNPTIRLAAIRGLIDRQQQVIALLENKLQESILGGTGTSATATDPTGQNTDLSLDGVLAQVAVIYGEGYNINGSNRLVLANPDTSLTHAMIKGSAVFQQVDETGAPLPLEQDGLRQLLYQARALMGELRVEEQHWNTEVQQEKERRKELGDFTKA